MPVVKMKPAELMEKLPHSQRKELTRALFAMRALHVKPDDYKHLIFFYQDRGRIVDVELDLSED